MTTAIRLKALLKQRHWQTHRTFCAEYDKAARTVDKSLTHTAPSRAQLHRWLSGDVRRLPYPDHCRVLEAMFPGWTVEQLFTPVDDEDETPPPAASSPQRRTPDSTSELVSTIAAGLSAPDSEHSDWGAGFKTGPSIPRQAGPADGESGDDFTAVLGRRLVALGRVLRLSAEETRQLGSLAGNVVNLGLDVIIDLDSDGKAAITYRHELLNLSPRPLTRITGEMWFEHSEGSLRLTAVNPRGRKLTVKRMHETPSLCNFAVQVLPEVQPGETVTIEYVCEGPIFVDNHYWRQCISRYTRYLTIELHQAGRKLAGFSATEEDPDSTENSIDHAVMHTPAGDDISLTVTRDYLKPNQYVTLRWDVTR